MKSVNPFTGATLAEYPEHEPAAVEDRLRAAWQVFPLWRQASFSARGQVLEAAARLLREERARLAELMTAEMGKPIAQAEAEVDKCAWLCSTVAQCAWPDLAPEFASTDASRSYVRCDPLGVLLAIMPWNFPLWQVFRAAAPALMAGNVVALKHASNVAGAALAIEDLFRQAGLPAGGFSTLLISAERAEALVDHPAIAAVTLTGSETAGVAIARRAGAALKKCVLELGGSDPFVVLADADPEAVAREAVAARLVNNGQSCIAAKRFIVEEPLAEAFEAAFVAAMERVTVGDPMDRAVTLGPLARPDLRDSLHDQAQRTAAAGARILTGGRPLERAGNFYPPTVLAGVLPGMPAFDEETFGPVAAVARARNTEQAIELANRSRFGLGASVWTRDPQRAEAIVPRIEAGAVFVNGVVKSDPRLPFGGVKHSGHGRELARDGIREFVNRKTVWIR